MTASTLTVDTSEPMDGTTATTPPALPDYVTQYQFATTFGIHKSTVKRAVDSGKIQAHRRPDGNRLFLPEALQYFQDKIKKHSQVIDTSSETSINHPKAPVSTPPESVAIPVSQLMELQAKVAAIETEAKFLTQMLEEERKRRQATEADRDRWHTAYQEMKALPAPIVQPEPQKTGFFARLFGRTA
jgi:hypothetical protein